MLDWHLGMLERPDGTPIDGLGPANVLDLCRVGAVPALAVLSAGWLALALLVIGNPRRARRSDRTSAGRGHAGSVSGSTGASTRSCLVTGAWLLVRADALPVWAGVLVSVRYLTPLVVVTFWYFLAAGAPPRHGYVPGRYPGVVLLAGPPAGAVVAAGRDRAGRHRRAHRAHDVRRDDVGLSRCPRLGKRDKA